MIHHAQSYALRIDGRLFRDQRRFLLRLADAWARGRGLTPQAGEVE